jgi:two-component system chemotaxis response regulator CheY
MAVNLLVVDDSSVMRSMIIKTVRMSGLQVGEIHQAADGLEGLDMLNRHWIDLALVDINMPVMSGEEMILQLRRDPGLKDTPVIVISTEGSTERIDRLLALGARFIHKPFSAEAFRDTVRELIGAGVIDE